MANCCAPFSDLNWPDTFCLIFMFRIVLSKPLLSGGTSGWSKNTHNELIFLVKLFIKAWSDLGAFSFWFVNATLSSFIFLIWLYNWKMVLVTYTSWIPMPCRLDSRNDEAIYSCSFEWNTSILVGYGRSIIDLSVLVFLAELPNNHWPELYLEVRSGSYLLLLDILY